MADNPVDNPSPADAAPDAALQQIIERGTLALAHNREMTLSELAAAITDEVPAFWTFPGQVIPFPELPTPVVLTGEMEKALLELPEVFGKVNVTDRREMTDVEILDVYKEHEALKALEDALKNRRDNLKTYVRHHMDVQAEREGRADVADSPRDKAGHYVLGEKGKPERLNIDGTNQAFSREASSYKASLSGERLTELFEADQITREQYLALTREVRVFDEEKARKSIMKDKTLLGVLARFTERGGMKSALYIRKAR